STTTPMVLTIDSGITIQGGSGSISKDTSYFTDAITLKGAINIASGQTLSLGGAWNNLGTIAMANSTTVNLGGTFSTASPGNFTATGAIVNVTGSLTNTSAALPLSANRGNWRLTGGTITGGTIASSDGSTLALTYYGGTLAGVTVGAGTTIDGTQ